jgi:DNA-binding HxlR family transcriptional regulator
MKYVVSSSALGFVISISDAAVHAGMVLLRLVGWMSTVYGRRCPVARTLEIIGERWTILILRDLMLRGPRKFQDLLVSLTGISPNTLSARLKTLEDNGIVERRFYEDHPPRAEYVLTEKGRDLRPVLRTLRDWGEKHTKFSSSDQ